MKILSQADIKKVVSMQDMINADKKAFMMFSAGRCDVPLRTIISVPKEDGFMCFMPAYCDELDCAVVKVVNQFPHNHEIGLPLTLSEVLMVDAKTGAVTTMLDGTYVTKLRTGAASGAALDVLARKDAKKGALFGTGAQAATQLEAMIAVRDLEEVKIFDVATDRIQPFVEKMSEELASYSTKFVAATSPDDAVSDADVIITMTPSKTPVFNADKIKKGVTISCVGSFQPDMEEADPRVMGMASKIFCDSKEAVLSESGELLIPIEMGIISPDDVTGDLGQVLLGELPGRENDDEIIVFKTVGIGAQDLFASKAIVDAATSAGLL